MCRGVVVDRYLKLKGARTRDGKSQPRLAICGIFTYQAKYIPNRVGMGGKVGSRLGVISPKEETSSPRYH